MRILSEFWTLLTSQGPEIPTLIVVFIASFVIWNESRRLPPGPVLVPLLGCIPRLVGSMSGEYVMTLAKRYKCDVISMRVMGTPFVFLNSYDVIKEHFVRRTDLVDRIDRNILAIADPNHGGLVMSSGKLWKELRRFTLHRMRDFGMGKATADAVICDETEKMLAHFSSTGCRPHDPRGVINMAVSNVICQFVMGKRFHYDDKHFQDVLDHLNTFVHTVSTPANVLTLRSKLGRWIFRRKLHGIQNHFGVFVGFVEHAIQDHRERWDGGVADMIDAFMKEMEGGQADPDIFNDFQLRCLIVDLFAAGSETTHTTLRWLLLYMATYQQVQEKVYEELCREVGADRLPTMADKKNTPYTEAVINEVERFNTIFQLGLMHTVRDRDFELGPYRLTRGTPVMPNLRAVHRDPEFWKFPERFDPNNFLQDGKLVNTERAVGFAIGRRSCAGESLARPELYIFFSSWLLKFHVSVPLGEEPDLDPAPGIGVRQPKPYQLVFRPR